MREMWRGRGLSGLPQQPRLRCQSRWTYGTLRPMTSGPADTPGPYIVISRAGGEPPASRRRECHSKETRCSSNDREQTGVISVAQAMEAARTQLSVPPGSTSNTSFGRLRDSRLGTRSDRSAWLVVFAVPSGTAWAFVDAVDGQMLET